MSMYPRPDQHTLMHWLEATDLKYYICEHCDGLHLPHLQEELGVIDSKLDLADNALYFTTTLELRPTALMLVYADLAFLNTEYPNLKVFVDLNDETLPSLVLCYNQFVDDGLSQQQFYRLLKAVEQQVRAVLAYCQQNNYLMEGAEAENQAAQSKGILH